MENKLSTAKLTDKVHEMYASILKKYDSLNMDLSLAARDLSRGRQAGNPDMEYRARVRLRDLRAQQAQRQRDWKEYHVLHDQLERHVNPLHPLFIGEQYDEENVSVGGKQ